MNRIVAIVIGILLLGVLLLFSMSYTVSYHQVAIKTRFGQTDENSVIREPGLKFKLPIFADKVTKFDKRLQLIESPEEQLQTADDMQLIIRAFLLWRVDTERPSGPLEFFQSYRTIDAAESFIDAQFRTALKSAASQYDFGDLIGADSKLLDVEQRVREELQTSLAAKGVLPQSVGISQVILPAKTTTSVLSRMQATRKDLSETERDKGAAEADRIESDAKYRKEKILAFAQNRAADIRAEGNEEAKKYLLEMGEDPDLAIFLAWLDALQTSLSQYTTLVIPTSTAPFHLMDLSAPTSEAGIPMPQDKPAPMRVANPRPDSSAGSASPSSAEGGQ